MNTFLIPEFEHLINFRSIAPTALIHPSSEIAPVNAVSSGILYLNFEIIAVVKLIPADFRLFESLYH
ncbi:Uncharacterised protein [Mycoplasmopsis cynos]|uniref:Uncharacterized protein n=1 Tax=Mycoplasmopsis cynos TaxID=171284 RepID=A0A449AGX2_9BACT|nr:hypothetical protein [Mycoplasmopsis cynos]VEU64266.1 Uncharacterised protein [Mycoplasmopsis cynos]